MEKEIEKLYSVRNFLTKKALSLFTSKKESDMYFEAIHAIEYQILKKEEVFKLMKRMRNNNTVDLHLN